MRKIFVVTFSLLLTSAPFSMAWSQSPQQSGRYHVVAGDFVFLLDTVSGRVWRYMLGTEHGSEKARSLCRGDNACFFEVDRLRLTDSGWQSEVYPTKR